MKMYLIIHFLHLTKNHYHLVDDFRITVEQKLDSQESMNISCHSGIIQILNVFYGLCDESSPLPEFDCRYNVEEEYFDNVTQNCNNETLCSVDRKDNSTVGSPCESYGNVTDYVTVVYMCSEETTG